MSFNQAYLKSKIQYDPETGLFWWPAPKAGHKWEQPAGSITSNGYITIKIDGQAYKAHQLAWVYMTGEWPLQQIDHINQIKSDNRWANLRQVSRSLNIANSRLRKDSSTGLKGVSRRPSGKWKATITKSGKSIHLGHFSSKEEAAEAYKNAHKELFKELYNA